MKSFDEFKQSREKMDPSARKLSKSQWQQAYEAYLRVRGYGVDGVEHATPAAEVDASPERGDRRGRIESSARMRSVRAQVRLRSAYRRERSIVDLLFWVALGLLALLGIGQVFTVLTVEVVFQENADMNGLEPVRVIQWGLIAQAVIQFGVGSVLAYLVRLMAHVLIDIPDVTLYHSCLEHNPEIAPVEVRRDV